MGLDSPQRFEVVKRLADSLMEQIAAVVPVLPIALISEVLLEHRNAWRSELDIKAQAVQKIATLKSQGAPIDISDNACEGVLSNGLNMLIGRRLVHVEGKMVKPDQNAMVLLEYYANSIRQWRAQP